MQTKSSLEKSKCTLEGEVADLANELKVVTSSRQESDRRKKQAEFQVQELSARLQDVDSNRNELGEKTMRMQVTNLLCILNVILFNIIFSIIWTN